jgi:hypothetical protein
VAECSLWAVVEPEASSRWGVGVNSL